MRMNLATLYLAIGFSACSPFARPFHQAEDAWRALQERCRPVKTRTYDTGFGYRLVRLPPQSLMRVLECGDRPGKRTSVWMGQSPVTLSDLRVLRGEDLAEGPDHVWPVEDRIEVMDLANLASRREGLEECYIVEGERVVMPRGVCCEGYRLPLASELEVASMTCVSNRQIVTFESDPRKTYLRENFGRGLNMGWHPDQPVVVSADRRSLFGVHDVSAGGTLAWSTQEDPSEGRVYAILSPGLSDVDGGEGARSVPVLREAPMAVNPEDLTVVYGSRWAFYSLDPECQTPGARQRLDGCRTQPPVSVRFARTAGVP